MYKRFGWNPEIRFEPIRDSDLPKKPSRIFVGSTMELFGEWVDAFWLDSIFRTAKDNPQHTFIFLTKRPENLIRFSPFPLNTYIGVSTTKKSELFPAIYGLSDIKCGKRFLSFEPLLEPVLDQGLPTEWNDAISWVIIGAQSPYSIKTFPKIAWINEIADACKGANIPYFEKNNLQRGLNRELIQGLPK